MFHSKMNRRKFMRQSLLMSSGLAATQLTACSTIDRWFGIEKKKFDDEVVIIGAGLSGLSAAFELKKKGIPYRVYEAAPRIGGRVYTLQNFNEDRQFVELGGEFFEAKQAKIFELCKELRISTEKIENESSLEKDLYFVRNKVMGRKEISQMFKPMALRFAQAQLEIFSDKSAQFNFRNRDQFPMASKYDAMSLKEFLLSSKEKIDADLLQSFENICVGQFGVDSSQQSCLHFLHSLDLEERENNYEGKTYHRIQGGNDVLVRTLYDRVAGIVPDYIVRLNHELVSLTEDNGYFVCLFQGSNGYEEIQARHLICTLPINQLKKIYGIDKLDLSDLKKEAIQKVELATHSKAMISFKDRFWKNKVDTSRPNQGTLLGGQYSQSIWESSRQQNGKRGILTFQCGGEKGVHASMDYLEKSLNELQLINHRMQNSLENIQHVVNWSTRKWVGGSVSFYRPNEYLKYNGVMAEPEYQGRLSFAGEHTHAKYHGTMVGAIESGQRAANDIASAATQKTNS